MIHHFAFSDDLYPTCFAIKTLFPGSLVWIFFYLDRTYLMQTKKTNHVHRTAMFFISFRKYHVSNVQNINRPEHKQFVLEKCIYRSNVTYKQNTQKCTSDQHDSCVLLFAPDSEQLKCNSFLSRAGQMISYKAAGLFFLRAINCN